MRAINILGCEVSDLSHAEALARVKNFIEDPHQHYIVTPNPEIVLRAQNDKNLRLILNHADLALPDGFGLKIGARVLGEQLYNRITGADFSESVIVLAQQEGWPIFLLGGKYEKISEQAAKNLRHKYKDIKIIGFASGGVVEFKQGKLQTSEQGLLEKIRSSGAKILFVGFGCPKQEKWIFQNLDKLPSVKLAITIGGTLDFFSGSRARAIYIMRKIGIEWLWRLGQEPSRIKRVWNATAVFLWTVIKWRARMMFAYRQNVVAAVINNHNEVLLIKRASKEDEQWQMPQGGVERGEDYECAVKRELFEETGISSVKIISMHPKKYKYEWPDKWHKLNNGYKGQKQMIFYLKYDGDCSYITLDKKEAADFSWIRLDDVVNMVYDKKKEMTKIAIDWYKKHEK